MSKKSLPQGWARTELKDVVKILDRKRIPVNARERELRKGNIPYYGATGQVGWIDDYIFNEELVLLGEDGAPFLEKTKPKAYVIKGKSWVNNHAHVLKTQSGLLTKTLCYYLNQIDYKEFVGGTTRLKLTQASMRSIPILIPPLNEQKRIVAKIESILGQIDAAKRRLEGTKTLLKQARQSVLREAFAGRLVLQDPEDVPARSSIQKVCGENNSSLLNDDLPEGWIVCPLSAISDINPNRQPDPAITDDSLVSFIPMKCVEKLSGKIDLSITRTYAQVKKGYTHFRDGDILLAKITPCIENGKIAIANNLKTGIGFGSTEFHVIRMKESISNKFYFWYFMQDAFRYAAQKKMAGTAGQLRVPSSYFTTLWVPLPPLAEQCRIVAKIESILGGIDAIEQNAINALSYLETLKRSVFKMAFEGRLVPQNPRHEPADVLIKGTKTRKTSNARNQRGVQRNDE